MPALPPDAHAYKRTPSFTETTIPDGLRHEHRTKAEVWGRIVVESGQLEYRRAGCSFVLTPQRPGVIAPEEPHQVNPVGPVSFHVEFLRVPAP